MNITSLIPCTKGNKEHYNAFANLYSAYIDELSAFSQRISKEEVSVSEIDFMWEAGNMEILLITVDEEIVGFVVLGIHDNKHEASDYFVGEFYIAKSKQGQGIGGATVKQLLNCRKGKYCMFILKKNERAICFWRTAFAHEGYRDVSKDYHCASVPDDCYFKMYAPIN